MGKLAVSTTAAVVHCKGLVECAGAQIDHKKRVGS